MECAALLLIFASVVATEEFTKYYSNDELYDFLREVNDNYPNISHLYSIGTSGKGEDLWVLMLSLAPLNKILVPNVKVIGNIHGDEPVGREVIIYFIKLLVKGYTEQDEEIIQLLNTTKLHFLPSANPDGFSKAVEGECSIGPGRKNANNKDLNRDFPPVFRVDEYESYKSRERETTAVMQWMSEIQFILSVSLHSGSNVVVYPYDESNSAHGEAVETETHDKDVFKHLALKYATHTGGAIYESCPNDPRFEDGIVNGAAWYSVRGSMSDYNYQYHGCMELTVELNCCKYPHPSKLNDIVNHHSQALLVLLNEARQGVKGVVTCGGSPAVSYIEVLNRDMTLKTTEEGEYWRMLLPGKYFLEVESKSCRTEIFSLEIPQQKTGEHPETVILNISLKKLRDSTNDEIELETVVDDDTLNVTVQDFMYHSSNTTEGKNVSISSDGNGFYLQPHMQSSVSLSTIKKISAHLIIGSSLILLLNYT